MNLNIVDPRMNKLVAGKCSVQHLAIVGVTLQKDYLLSIFSSRGIRRGELLPSLVRRHRCRR